MARASDGPDAVGAEQRLEAPALVGVGEAVEHDGVLADVGVDVQEDLAARSAPRPASDGGRHRRPVADAADLDDDLAGGRPVDQRPPQRADHGAPPRSAAAATARRSGWVVRWQAARARASATSGGRGGSARPSTGATMRWTWSLVARAVADHGLLDLVGGVLGHLAAGLGRRHQGHAGGLAGGHGRPGVHLEEDPLDHHGVRAELGHQGPQLVGQGAQALGQGHRGRGRDHPAGHRGQTRRPRRVTTP